MSKTVSLVKYVSGILAVIAVITGVYFSTSNLNHAEEPAETPSNEPLKYEVTAPDFISMDSNSTSVLTLGTLLEPSSQESFYVTDFASLVDAPMERGKLLDMLVHESGLIDVSVENDSYILNVTAYNPSADSESKAADCEIVELDVYAMIGENGSTSADLENLRVLGIGLGTPEASLFEAFGESDGESHMAGDSVSNYDRRFLSDEPQVSSYDFVIVDKECIATFRVNDKTGLVYGIDARSTIHEAGDARDDIDDENHDESYGEGVKYKHDSQAEQDNYRLTRASGICKALPYAIEVKGFEIKLRHTTLGEVIGSQIGEMATPVQSEETFDDEDSWPDKGDLYTLKVGDSSIMLGTSLPQGASSPTDGVIVSVSCESAEVLSKEISYNGCFLSEPPKALVQSLGRPQMRHGNGYYYNAKTKGDDTFKVSFRADFDVAEHLKRFSLYS